MRQARSGMQSTHTIHTQSLGHRTHLGKGEKRRERRLVSDYSLNACNEPENLLCAQIRSCWRSDGPGHGHGLEETDRQQRMHDEQVLLLSISHPFRYSSPILSSAIYFCLSPLSLSSSLSALSAAWKEEKSARERRQRFAGDIGHNK